VERLLRTLWGRRQYHCLLFRVDGRLEVRLYLDWKVEHVSTCRDLDDAVAKANTLLAETLPT
jgi:hypothetical protein